MDGIVRPEDISDIEIHTVDHVFLKRFVVPSPAILPQHSHAYEHLTMLVRGSVKLWNGEDIEHYDAPAAIVVPAGVKHTFVTLEANTEFWCIHNTLRREIVEVLEEHHLVEPGGATSSV